MGRKIGELEARIRIEGTILGSGDSKYEGRSHLRTSRPIEDSLWKLAIKAGYTFGDRIEYEIIVRRKPG